MLGKRKREIVLMRGRKEEESTESQSDHHQLFRQYFESRFEPLPEEEAQTPCLIDESDRDSDDSEESEWEGFSEEEHTSPAVQVVEHAKPATADSDDVQRSELKAFMASLMLLWQNSHVDRLSDLQASSEDRGEREERL